MANDSLVHPTFALNLHACDLLSTSLKKAQALLEVAIHDGSFLHHGMNVYYYICTIGDLVANALRACDDLCKEPEGKKGNGKTN
jgi:hypothetical protein